MPTVVLVPGAWHGGWCWRDVIRHLHGAGARAVPVTLTGLGERAHLYSPDVGLATHVEDVGRVLEAEELENVVLVGHSYAGVLLGAVAERAEGRVAALVYLDALVPTGAESALELFPETVANSLTAAADAGVVPPWPASSFGVADPIQAAWVDRHLTPHPLRTFVEAGATPPAGMPRLFIACTVRQRPTYLRFADAARSGSEWEYAELACGHDAMVIVPGPLSEILLGFARRF